MTQDGLGLRGYLAVIRGSFAHVSEHNLALIAAGVAFFAMLSIFPGLAALIALLALIADPSVVVAELEQLRPFLPGDVYAIVNAQIVSLVTTSSDRLGWAGLVSLLLAVWSARAGVSAMITGLNEVHQARDRDAAWHYLRALALTLGLMAVGLTAVLTLVVIPIVLAFFPLGVLGTFAVELLRWCVAVAVLLGGIGVLYRFGPNQRRQVPWLSLGAVVAVVFWVAMSVGFSYYVANFGNYNQVYGSIGAVIAMLVWLWLSSFVVLFGAVLNVQIALARA